MDKDYTPFEAHHFYWGLLLILIAFILIFVECIPLLIIYIGFGLGVILMVDDAIQHIKQRKDRTYHSPIHQFYGKYLWPIPWIQKLNKWVDNLL